MLIFVFNFLLPNAFFIKKIAFIQCGGSFLSSLYAAENNLKESVYKNYHRVARNSKNRRSQKSLTYNSVCVIKRWPIY